MRVIAMVPTRNEAWVIGHSLACLSAFCDVVLVSDRHSEDDTRAIAARFPKAVVLDAHPESRIREQRWQMLDAARQYDGVNLLWATDADELLSQAAANAFLEHQRERLVPGTAIDVRYYHLWNEAGRYRNDPSPYAPQWKRVGFVDDRRSDFDRSQPRALHEPRVPAADDAPAVEAEDVALLHLQWLIPGRNQLKQAWYRCREWLDGGRSAAAINETYSATFHDADKPTVAAPREWIEDLTFPDEASDRLPSWHQTELLAWFDQHGIERFEPLEIWHVPLLRDEFRRRVGRSPKPDRSYVPPWSARARQYGRRMINGVRRRLPI